MLSALRIVLKRWAMMIEVLPTRVSYPSGRETMKSWIFAFLQASSISSWVASSFAYFKLSRIVPLKR
ncbi:MAG: hypothetical protein SO238_04985 [Treponema sp.]|nr:hypothetical protein [Treponema sp.]